MRPMRVRWGLEEINPGAWKTGHRVVSPTDRTCRSYGYGAAIEWDAEKSMVLIRTTEKPARLIQLPLEVVELLDDEGGE